jgi:hypothetical protein
MRTPLKIATVAILAVIAFAVVDRGICAVFNASGAALRADLFWPFNISLAVLSAVVAVAVAALAWRKKMSRHSTAG